MVGSHGSARATEQSVHVDELSAAMARAGHDVTVYIRRDDPRLPEFVRTDRGYSIVHVPAGLAGPLPEDEALGQMGTFARRLAEQWRSDRPDIAHAHFWMAGIATQLAAQESSVPTVQTFHGVDTAERHGPGVRTKVERLIARNADWVVATFTGEVIEVSRMGRSRTRISVVPGGVDLDDFCTVGDVAPSGPVPRILSVGPMVPHQGFSTLIEAIPMISGAELVIAGGPDPEDLDHDPEVGRLRRLAVELGVAERVSFTGAVARRDMAALLRSADVVACTPWFEPFAMVPLQAMACGVPVVASAVGAMLDTVVHEVTGRLVTPRRPRECAEALSAILRDSFLRRSLGLAGRDRARARFSWDRVGADTLRVYQGVAADPAPALPLLSRAGRCPAG